MNKHLSHFLQGSGQNGQRFKSLWGIGLCRALTWKPLPADFCTWYLLPPSYTEWPSHVCSYQMSLKSILDSYTFLYYVCSWLYYTGTFVVMCLNTCDRKHLQTWNNFTFVGNNQSVSFILIVETKVSGNFSFQTLLKRGIYIFIV